MLILHRLSLRKPFALLTLTLSLFYFAWTVRGQDTKDEKIDIGGYRLHAVTAGSGNPTVVFESGMAEDYTNWKDVQSVVAKSTRTVMYDRAGLGSSDPSPHLRDAQHMAQELHALLHSAKIPGPYILVGHSLGGWVVLVFAHLYPKEIAGMVLVDPAFQGPRMRARMTEQEWARRESAIVEHTPKMTKYQQLEKDAYDLSGEQALCVFPLPAVPTVLLTATLIYPDFPSSSLEREVKTEVHNEWATKMPGTEHIFVPESRHYIQNDAPPIVISAIQRVLQRAGKSKR